VQVKALVASLSEVNIDEAIKAAPAMMAAAPAAAPAGEAKPAAAAPEDKKKKAEEEKAKEEAALEGLGALFENKLFLFLTNFFLLIIYLNSQRDK
jgi:large subunit ribosomal protein L12